MVGTIISGWDTQTLSITTSFVKIFMTRKIGVKKYPSKYPHA